MNFKENKVSKKVASTIFYIWFMIIPPPQLGSWEKFHKIKPKNKRTPLTNTDAPGQTSTATVNKKISQTPSQDQFKKRKNTKIIKSEKRHAQELILVHGQMVKSTKIKDIPCATIKNHMQTSAIHRREARKNNNTIEKNKEEVEPYKVSSSLSSESRTSADAVYTA
jgi:hypothetical protein